MKYKLVNTMVISAIHPQGFQAVFTISTWRVSDSKVPQVSLYRKDEDGREVYMGTFESVDLAMLQITERQWEIQDRVVNYWELTK